MPLDDPPVVVTIQRTDAVRQQRVMEPFDDRNRLVPLHFADRAGTKINIWPEPSRPGFTCQVEPRGRLAVSIAPVDRGLLRPEQGNWLFSPLGNVVKLVTHHLGEQSPATI